MKNGDWAYEILKEFVEDKKIHGKVIFNSDGQGNIIDSEIVLKRRPPKLENEKFVAHPLLQQAVKMDIQR